MRYAYLTVVILFVAASGCWSGRTCSHCKPLNQEGAIVDANGTTVNQWLCRQAENGLQASSGTIYQADWIGTTDRLSPFGRKQLASWANSGVVQTGLFIETSGDPVLDSSRLAAVSGYLGQVGFAISPDSIHLANFDEGLSGEEVPPIADRFLGDSGVQGRSDRSETFGVGSGAQQNGGFF